MQLEKVREAAERVAGSLGLEIFDVEWKVGKDRLLRVYIDRLPGPQNPEGLGVTHKDCERVSEQLSVILDVEDLIPGPSYVLEVSSPGLDRKLSRAADFERFVGSRLKLMTRQPINKNQHFEGRLESFENGRLTLDMSVASKKSRKKMGVGAGEEKIQIEFANVEKANLVPEI